MAFFLPHFNLQKFNTLAVPAIADWYVSVTTDTELGAALAYARERHLAVLVLGGGSNLVLRDDFRGLVIHMRSQGKELLNETDEHVWLKVAAGENWHDLVQYALAQGFYGLENLSLIPGSVGAAPIQNIGAYGVELKDVFVELSALEMHSGLLVTFPLDACRFGYRDSIFKQSLKDQYIITSVTLRLHKTPQLVLNYPALQSAFANTPMDTISPQDVSDTVISIRQSKLPDPTDIPNVGSFFKNPVVDMITYTALKNKFPDLVAYPAGDNHFKLAAGWLIDRAGWRGKCQDGAEVHQHQALVLTNPGRKSGAAVLALASSIQASIVAMFGVQLEMEPRVYPE